MGDKAVFRTSYSSGTPVIAPESVTGFDIMGYSCFNERSIHPNSPNVLMWLWFGSEAEKNEMKVYMDFVKDVEDSE